MKKDTNTIYCTDNVQNSKTFSKHETQHRDLHVYNIQGFLIILYE